MVEEIKKQEDKHKDGEIIKLNPQQQANLINSNMHISNAQFEMEKAQLYQHSANLKFQSSINSIFKLYEIDVTKYELVFGQNNEIATLKQIKPAINKVEPKPEVKQVDEEAKQE